MLNIDLERISTLWLDIGVLIALRAFILLLRATIFLLRAVDPPDDQPARPDIDADPGNQAGPAATGQYQLSTVNTRQVDLKVFAKEHPALPSPAQRIYPELLSEIFSFFVHSNPSRSRWSLDDNFDPSHGPLLLTRICRSWRMAAIATSDLWTTIRFVVKPRHRFHLMDMWLERSKARNLTIAVIDHPETYSEFEFILAASTPCNQRALRLLSSQAHRWESASFHLPLLALCWDAFATAKGRTKQLVGLEICVTRPTRQDPVPDIISNASQLTYLDLTDCLFPNSRRQIRGEGITQLHYTVHTHFPLKSLLDCLLCLPNLETCIIVRNQRGFARIQNPSNRVVSLPKLLTLRITQSWVPSRQWHGMIEILQALLLPNLVELEIMCQRRSGDTYHVRVGWPHLPFLSCIARYSKLQRLTLLSPSLQQQHLVELFQQIPSVTTLEFALSDIGWDSSVLDHLAARSSLPNLSNLEIVIFPGTLGLSRTFIRRFMQTVKDRMEGAEGQAQLQSAHLKFEAGDGNPTNPSLILIHRMLRSSKGIRLHQDSNGIVLVKQRAQTRSPA